MILVQLIMPGLLLLGIIRLVQLIIKMLGIFIKMLGIFMLQGIQLIHMVLLVLGIFLLPGMRLVQLLLGMRLGTMLLKLLMELLVLL